MHNIDLWQVLAFLFLLSPAVAQMTREWAGRPMFSTKHLWAARWTICLLIGGAIFFGREWFEPVGFDANWPNAVKGKWSEYKNDNPSTMIFTLESTHAARTVAGDVAIYQMPGGCNSPMVLCDPDELGCSENSAKFSRPDYHSPENSPDHDLRNAPPTAYYPHELWFNMHTGQLFRPEKTKYQELDQHGRRYKFCFLSGIDLGGDAIRQIEKSGNAYSLARRWQ